MQQNSEFIQYYSVYITENIFVIYIGNFPWGSHAVEHCNVYFGENQWKWGRHRQHSNAASANSHATKILSMQKCTRAFGKAQLIQHQRIHNGRKLYVCNGCKNALRWCPELIRHLGFCSRQGPCEHNVWGRTFHQSSILRWYQLIRVGLKMVIRNEDGKLGEA